MIITDSQGKMMSLEEPCDTKRLLSVESKLLRLEPEVRNQVLSEALEAASEGDLELLQLADILASSGIRNLGRTTALQVLYAIGVLHLRSTGTSTR